MKVLTERTLEYRVPSLASPEEVAEDLQRLITKNITRSSAYHSLELSTEGCDFNAYVVWERFDPYTEDRNSMLRGCYVTHQSLDKLVIRFARNKPHIDIQMIMCHLLENCLPYPFKAGMEVPNNMENSKQSQVADFSVYNLETKVRRIVGEVMLSESVGHAMKKMMSQRYTNPDINLFILTFIFKNPKVNGQVNGFQKVVQFYEPILNNEEAAGRTTTEAFGANMIGEKYFRNGRKKAVEFPGMNRRLADGWDLCLVDQFVGYYDSDGGTPVQMQVIGPMNNAALKVPLDLSEGSEDCQKLFNFNVAPYIGEKNGVRNLDVRQFFAFTNVDKLQWFKSDCQQKSKEFTDVRDPLQVNVIHRIYDEEIARKEQDEKDLEAALESDGSVESYDDTDGDPNFKASVSTVSAPAASSVASRLPVRRKRKRGVENEE